VTRFGNISVFVDGFTEKHLDEKVTLDYDDAQGFKLFSSNEIYSYGLAFNKKNKF
jgi:hypothetical protein